jgi:hypothetical protein
MPQLRRIPVRLGRLALRLLPWEHGREKIEAYINALLEYAADRVVVLPRMDQSLDPENGELLFDGGKLWIAIDGEYKQLWPHPEGGGGGTQVVTTPSPTTPVVEGPRIIEYVSMVFDSGTSLALIDGTSDKTIRICYLEFSNASSADTIVGVQYSSSAQVLCKNFLPKSGGTVVQNFFGTELIDGSIGDSVAVVAEAAVAGSIYVTLGYYLQ